jgi:hypothetical protein
LKPPTDGSDETRQPWRCAGGKNGQRDNCRELSTSSMVERGFNQGPVLPEGEGDSRRDGSDPQREVDDQVVPEDLVDLEPQVAGTPPAQPERRYHAGEYRLALSGW